MRRTEVFFGTASTATATTPYPINTPMAAAGAASDNKTLRILMGRPPCNQPRANSDHCSGESLIPVRSRAKLKRRPTIALFQRLPTRLTGPP